MLNNLQKLRTKQSEKGFTIIEVMIVLAIAGLIILIVFLAVPALQRNSRNTQRKSDIGTIGGAVNEYISNNNGKLPNQASDFTGNVKPGYYDVANISYAPSYAAPTADFDKVYVFGKTKCTDNTPGASTSARQAAIVYYVESGSGGTTQQCKEV